MDCAAGVLHGSRDQTSSGTDDNHLLCTLNIMFKRRSRGTVIFFKTRTLHASTRHNRIGNMQIRGNMSTNTVFYGLRRWRIAWKPRSNVQQKVQSTSSTMGDTKGCPCGYFVDIFPLIVILYCCAAWASSSLKKKMADGCRRLLLLLTRGANPGVWFAPSNQRKRPWCCVLCHWSTLATTNANTRFRCFASLVSTVWTVGELACGREEDSLSPPPSIFFWIYPK